MTKMTKCRACEREASSNELCRYHREVYDRLKSGYDKWCDAYGEIGWKAYLERLLKLKDIGFWIKDVIVLELAKEKKG